MVRQSDVATDAFEAFMRDAEPRLWRALTVGFGPVVAREAAADALAWGWEHWERLRGMVNPVGYLFRIGQNRARRTLRNRQPPPTIPTASHEVTIEPALTAGLQALSERQRLVVGLIHGYGWSFAEVGDLLGIAKSSVQRHEERGMAALRKHLGVLT
jgi:DNA-directed RNA polymerase specialized sigma24 family protein